jgi:predicted nucleotidyltransferase
MQIYDRSKYTNVNDMIKFVHDNCPEWKDSKGMSMPIKLNEILENIHKSSERIDWILAKKQAFEEEENTLLSLTE